MTILDRVRGTRNIRIDVSQLADELSKHVPDFDKAGLDKIDLEKLDLDKVDLAKDLGRVDLGKARDAAEHALHEAADFARESLDRAGDRARTLRSDIAQTADKVGPDISLDDIGQRIRSVVNRVERELPDTDKDRYDRAYARGRVQARSMFLVVGLAAGVTTGVVAAILLDPRHGKARREAIGRRVGRLTDGLGARLAGTARDAGERARGVAVERGLVKPADEGAPPEGAVPVAAPAWPTDQGPITSPLEDPAFGAHEALPEELVAATTAPDPADDALRS